jgi:hypothetical protein
MPGGAYEVGLEWEAPCGDWFETDVCPSPANPIGLYFRGGVISFLSEEYLSFQDGRSLPWPFDPWSRSEPIPEP